MDHFNYRRGVLHAEEVALSEIANAHGTPTYVYSRATIERHWHAFDDALGSHPHLICYAVKANSNLAVLNLLARLGSGFDIVSGGELQRVLAAGGNPDKTVFSGVGKRTDEIELALREKIRCFNVESAPELDRIAEISMANGVVAPISIRVNPDVDAGTHPYISTGLKENKFGVDMQQAIELYSRCADSEYLNAIGIDCHIGSQLTSMAPLLDALDRLLEMADTLRTRGIEIRHLDLGGGLGIRYDNENPPEPAAYARAVTERLQGAPYEIWLEPGRAIMGNAGVLLMRVEYLKRNGDKHFMIVDAAMNDNMRPALYGAWQNIIPVIEPDSDVGVVECDVVGPVCESGDFLGKDRTVSANAGDLLVMRSTGAYGFTMSSNYNTRPRAAEVMVDKEKVFLVNPRESIDELIARESVLPE